MVEKSERGFVLYPTYSVFGKKAYVYLYGRLDNGESFLSVSEFKPYFFIEKKDEKKSSTLVKSISGLESEVSFEKSDFKNFENKEMTQVILEIPKEVPVLRKTFEEYSVECYEADIRFPYRFMIDKEIQGYLNLKGDFKTKNKDGFIQSEFDDNNFYVDRLYLNPEISSVETKDTPKLKIASVDIETDQNAKDLYAISTYFKDISGKSKTISYVISDKKVKGALNFKDEKSLLEQFLKDIRENDPDLILGWNVIDFDFDVLQKKFKQRNVPFKLGRSNDTSRLNIQQQFFMDSKANFHGRMVLDGIHLLKISHVALNDYKLDTAAKAILGERKLITDVTKKGTIIDDMFKDNKEDLVKYNAKDAKLVVDILEAKNIINLTTTRSKVTGMPLDRVQASVATMDSLYLRETKKRKIVCYSSKYSDKDKGILGGYVMNPKTGIHDNIIVLDFKSLYPSIMITFNIDPLSFSKKGTIIAPNGARFLNQEGILPHMIDTIWKERDKAKKRKDDIASYALKVVLNSFFGVLANPKCRFYSYDMANAITHFGQYIIKNTANELKKKNYDVLYSDTDSVFVKTGAKNIEEAEKIGNKIVDEINDYYKKLVKKEYSRESRLELEYEKVYKKIIFPTIRGSDDSEIGAKKRYAGLLIKNGKEKMEFTGLEFVRRDWTEVSKKFQLELLDRIFHEKEVTSYVKKFVQDIRAKKYDDLLVYTKAIRKDLSSYTKTTPPHVKAARKLKRLDSNIIKYVITTDGPEPIQEQNHSIDYDHYIDKQIKPIADTVLGFFDTSFDDLMKGTTQKSLFNY
jgi:DNA polymerase-2